MAIFDWNHDGKKNFIDNAIEMMILDDLEEDEKKTSFGSYEASDTSEEDWRENYDIDYELDLDPDDYDTEEEYLEALEEKQEELENRDYSCMDSCELKEILTDAETSYNDRIEILEMVGLTAADISDMSFDELETALDSVDESLFLLSRTTKHLRNYQLAYLGLESDAIDEIEKVLIRNALEQAGLDPDDYDIDAML